MMQREAMELPWLRLAAYGLPALVLAAAALPIYVHLPHLYGGELGMNLALLGAVLLAARLADAFIDPLIGALVDRWRKPKLLIVAGMVLLVAGTMLAFHPPQSAKHLWGWLALALAPLYLGYSLASIAHLAWGSLLGGSAHERTRVSAWREGWGLAGVIAASLLPMLLAGGLDDGLQQGLARYSLILALGAMACTLIMLAAAPPAGTPRMAAPTLSLRVLLQPLRHAGFRRLYGVFLLNGIAGALPATLVLFFIGDALGLAGESGTFLAAYFGAGAVGLPLWLVLSRRIGKEPAWAVAMLLAVAGFTGAYTLGQGDYAGFLAVCLVSGLALGADLVLPPALLADLVRGDDPLSAGASAGFGADASEGIGAGAAKGLGAGASAGLWNFATKLNLALAAGLALPLLQFSGYTPGGTHVAPLYWAYCLAPCALKLAAAALLLRRAPLPHTNPSLETAT